MMTLARMYFVWRLPVDPCFLLVAAVIIIALLSYFLRNIFRDNKEN